MGVVGALVVFAAGVGVGQQTTKSLYSDFAVLSVPVVHTNPADVAPINARLVEEQRNDSDLPTAIGRILPLVAAPVAREQAVLVKRLEGDAQTYRVDVLQGDVPDDDSVAGRFSRLILARDDKGNWKVSSGTEAWRCWEDRGHTHFDNTPCN